MKSVAMGIPGNALRDVSTVMYDAQACLNFYITLEFITYRHSLNVGIYLTWAYTKLGHTLNAGFLRYLKFSPNSLIP